MQTTIEQALEEAAQAEANEMAAHEAQALEAFRKEGIEPEKLVFFYVDRLKKYFATIEFAPKDFWHFKDGCILKNKTFSAPDTETLMQKVTAIAPLWHQGNQYPNL